MNALIKSSEESMGLGGHSTNFAHKFSSYATGNIFQLVKCSLDLVRDCSDIVRVTLIIF